MNKAYRVIWSKVKNCYVVASELAKSHSKVSVSGVSRAMMAGVLACVFSFGAVIPMAEAYTYSGKTQTVSDLDGDANVTTVTGKSNITVSGNVALGKTLTNVVYNETYGNNNRTFNINLPTGNFTKESLTSYIRELGNQIAVPASSYSAQSDGSPGNAVTIDSSANLSTNLSQTVYPIYHASQALGGISTNNAGDVVGVICTYHGASRMVYDADESEHDTWIVIAGDVAKQKVEIAEVSQEVHDQGGFWDETLLDDAHNHFNTQTINVPPDLNVSSNSQLKTNGNITLTNGTLTVSGSSNVTTTGNLNTKAINSTDSTITSSGDITTQTLKATNGTLTGKNIKNTSGNLNATGSDVTATESVTTAGVVMAKTIDTPVLKASGNNMSTLGGGLTVAGQVKGVTTGTADTDAVNVKQLKDYVSANDKDTHWTSHMYVGSGTAANAATTNGNTKIALADNSTVRNTLTIKGTGATSVTSDANGVITINSANTTYSNMTAATADAAGKAGLVPAPAKGKQTAFLRGDGTWVVPTDNNTTYTAGAGLTLSGTKFSVKGDGKVVSGDTGLVTGNTVYEALQNIDISGGIEYTSGKGIVIDNNHKVSTKNVVMYDADENDVATLAGTKGTKLTNLKAGELSKSSKDAVIGNQLWTTNQNMAGMKTDINTNKENISSLNTSMTNALESVSTLNTLVNTIDTLKADASLNNLTNAGKQVISTAAANAVQEYMAGNGKVVPVNKFMSKVSFDKTIGSDNVVAYDDAGASVITLEGEVGVGTKVSNVAEGDVSAASMDAVNGSQLYAVQQQFDTFQSSLSTNNATIASVQTDVNNMKTNYLNLNSNVNTLQIQVETGFNVTIDGAKVKTVTPEANSINFIAGDNVSLVNENGSVKISFAGGAGGSDDSKANADASNVADHTADWGAAIGTGVVESGNGELVTGNTVYTALEDTKVEMQDALDMKADKDSVYTKDETDTLLFDKADRAELDTKADIAYVDESLAGKADKADLEAKANVDASNIEADAWADKLGVGAVEEGNTGLVNGGTVYEALQGVSGNDLIKNGNGAIEIGSNAKYDGVDAVSIAKSDGSGRVLRGVLVDPMDETSAANVGYVNGIAGGLASEMNRGFTKLDSKINKTGAGAAALANLHPLNDDGDTKWNVAAGFGRYHGESAGALGVFFKPSDRVSMNISSTVGNNDTMFGAGVTFAVDKPMANGLSKVEMAKEIQQMKLEREQDRARIAQLEAMVREMAKK